MFKRSEYSGKPILVLMRSEDDKFPFSFGINKANLDNRLNKKILTKNIKQLFIIIINKLFSIK